MAKIALDYASVFVASPEASIFAAVRQSLTAFTGAVGGHFKIVIPRTSWMD